jgi:hypothetical protein
VISNSQQIEFEINQLLKCRDSDSEAWASNHQGILKDLQSNRINLHTLFESWVRENKILGENFILVWLNKPEQPKSFYDIAKSNLCDRQKHQNQVFTEEDFVEELTKQFNKALTEK